MSEPIIVTDEMRRAVAIDECNRTGHRFDATAAIVTDLATGSSHVPAELEDGTLPHIRCYRCDMAWIIVPDPGTDYNDAETKLRGRLYKTDPINKRPERPGKHPKPVTKP